MIRQAFLFFFAFAFAHSVMAQPQLDSAKGSDGLTGGIWTSDVVLGDNQAPVMLVEYASWTCSFCALFHQQAVTPIIKPLIDEGVVRFIARDLLRNWIDLRLATVTRCSSVDYVTASEVLFSNQDLYRVNDTDQVNAAIGRLLGLEDAELEACLDDNALKEWLVERTSEAFELGVTSTPTLFINGKRFDIRNLDSLDLYIREIAAQKAL